MTDINNRQIIGDGATWATSMQVGAPQMTGASNANGQLLQVLDAVLIDGFNSQTSTGVESLPDGFLKIKFGTVVDYHHRQKLLISGANDENLNGEHIITQVLGNDVVIKAPDVTVLTGTIKTKVAPLGWESIFGTTDPLKRAYRSKNPNSTQAVLYLDMTLPVGHKYHASRPAHRAMVSICENMTELGVQINSYTDTTNEYTKNVNGSLFWYQARSYFHSSALEYSTPNEWTIIGNGDYFYFLPSWIDFNRDGFTSQQIGYRDFYCFGDIPSLAGISDDWSCTWAGSYLVNDANSSPNYGVSNGASIGSTNSKFFISSYNGVGTMVPFSFSGGGIGSYFSGVVGGITYPNQTTQSMICESLSAVSQNTVRALVPRMLSIKHQLPADFTAKYDNKFIDDFLIVSVGAVNKTQVPNPILNGYFAFDMGD